MAYSASNCCKARRPIWSSCEGASPDQNQSTPSFDEISFVVNAAGHPHVRTRRCRMSAEVAVPAGMRVRGIEEPLSRSVKDGKVPELFNADREDMQTVVLAVAIGGKRIWNINIRRS